MVPVIYPSGLATGNHVNGKRSQQSKKTKSHKAKVSKFKSSSKLSCPSFKTALIWFFAVVVLAALGVTVWLTRNIPFGTNCGNTHRALLGILIAIVIGGILMPLYYKYIKRDLIEKDLYSQLRAIANSTTSFDIEVITENKKHKLSALASGRFRLALKVATFILIVLVALGYYYLWSEENRCEDPSLWIVKGWFIALLGVAIMALTFTLSAMFLASMKRRKLKAARDNLDLASINNQSVASASPFVDTPAFVGQKPENVPSGPSQHLAQPQAHHDQDKHVLVQIEESLSEQQQQQQRHQAQYNHSQAGYGASGTGAYC
ncbi:hypothetical protein BGX27_000288 [Mortierella sp. AM989]|nr:hypothetical protein BGX27_000288 [Mortierella sp. AM989]